MQPVAPPPQIPDGAPINLEQAKKVMAGAEAEAKGKWNMVISVLDSGGHLVLLERSGSLSLLMLTRKKRSGCKSSVQENDVN